MFHDRRQTEARAKMTPEQLAQNPLYDYLAPIVADGDTGFGGITSVMKMTKLFIEAGAGGKKLFRINRDKIYRYMYLPIEKFICSFSFIY